MKRDIARWAVGILSLFFIAYGGASDAVKSDQTLLVNQIGKWQVISTMEGNSCKEKRAIFYQTIKPRKGDDHTMGDLIYEGDFFVFDENGTCRLAPISGVTPLNAPSIMTKQQFRTYEWHDMTNQGDIKHFEITHYSQKNISIKIEYRDGSILYQTFNRM